MTRLSVNDIKLVSSRIKNYDKMLFDITGASLKQIAAEAAGSGAELVCPEQYSVAVIPVTSGLGKIEGFSEAVQAVGNHLGFRTIVTSIPDVRGIAEAYHSGADIIMLADDHVFIAINVRSKRIVDNTEATAKGYVTALKFLVDGLADKEVLLIGAGRLGRKAAECLVDLGAKVAIYDVKKHLESSIAKDLSNKYNSKVLSGFTLDEALSKNNIIFDASSGGGFITGDQIAGQTYMAAPGVPLGLDRNALCKLTGRVIHDPLQIGVATMLYMSLM